MHQLLKIVPSAKFVAFLDADVKFSNPHWVKETVHALHHYHVVQLFSQAINLNSKFEQMWNCNSRFFCFANKGFSQKPEKELKYIANGHPGLAWAFTIDALNNLGGLLDFAVTGSGDTHMANALMGDVIFNAKKGMSAGFERALKRWAEKCNKHIKQNIGYVNGICFHYWHGKSEERGYDKRWDITCFHGYDPSEDIYIAANQLYTFTGNKPQLEYDLRLSTSARNEDDLK